MSSSEISKRLGIHPATVSTLAKRYKLPINKLGYNKLRYSLSEIQKALASAKTLNAHNKRFLEPSNTKIYNDYWKLKWDEFIVTCDTHTPFYNERIFNKIIQIADKYKIKNFIHAGDFWDQLQFSHFDVDPKEMVRTDQDIECGQNIIKQLIDTFKNVYFILGSHDVRFWLFMLRQGKASEYDEIWGLLGKELRNRINISKYRYCEIGDEWRITHPKNVLRVGGMPAIRLSAKVQRSVIFAHGHWFGMTRDPSGKHWLIAPGCLCDPQRIGYKSTTDTSHDEWVPGFCMVLDKNKPILFSEDSPYEIYLGKK